MIEVTQDGERAIHVACKGVVYRMTRCYECLGCGSFARKATPGVEVPRFRRAAND